LRKKSFRKKSTRFDKPNTNDFGNKHTDQELERIQALDEAYELEKQKRLYISPVAFIPYAHKSKEVQPWGF
jgi:hypothetical protein